MTTPTLAPEIHFAAPAVDVDAAVHECLAAILMGQPIPERWRAAAPFLIGPMEVRERVERILNGM